MKIDSDLLLTILWILFAWILVRILVPRLLLDSFRDNLFALRGELFDLAASGQGLDFDSNAYRSLEALINSNLRFAERMKPSILFATFSLRKRESGNRLEMDRLAMEERFTNNLKEIQNPEAIRAYKGIRKRMEESIAKRFLFASWLVIPLVLALILGIPILLISAVVGALGKVIALARMTTIRQVRTIEAAACYDQV